jgi:hypothetical protein
LLTVGILMDLKSRLQNGLVAPAVLAVLLGTSAVGAMVLVSTPAYAQTSLDSMQVASLRSSLMAAVAAAKGDPMAVTSAISASVARSLAVYGCAAAASITSATIRAAEQAGASSDAIGRALAQAAVTSKGACGVATGELIAQTLANEGRVAEIAAFQSEALALGQPQLASIAGSSAMPTAETTTGGANGGGVGGAVGDGVGGGTCLNPSCTK